MKTSFVKHALALGIGLLAIIGLVVVTQFKSQPVLGSVAQTNEYQSTTTSATFAVAPGYKVLKIGEGTLGSVIITTTGANGMNLYDASTTINGALYGTTTLAKFGSLGTAGTYTFDTIFHTGLIVETLGTNAGTTTITWR